MKKFNYSIQWLFYVAPNFITPVDKLKRNFFSVLKILGPKSLDKIIFRDENLKIIVKYTKMNTYSDGEVLTYCMRDIRKILKKDNRIYSIELFKK